MQDPESKIKIPNSKIQNQTYPTFRQGCRSNNSNKIKNSRSKIGFFQSQIFRNSLPI